VKLRIQFWVQFFEKINLSSRTVPNIGPNSNSVSVTNQNQQFKPSKLGAGVNQQPPMHQLRMRPLKPFWDEPKPRPPCPNICIFSCLYSASKHFSPIYLPPTYLLPTPSYFPPTSPFLPPISSLRSSSPECQSWNGSTRAGAGVPKPEQEH
jgi:hypothetical protein